MAFHADINSCWHGAGQIATVATVANLFIMPFLIVMLFGVFLQVPLQNLKKAFMNRKVAILSL